MGTYSRIILSGSTDGQGILAAATTPAGGTLLHTAVTGAADSSDEVWLYAHCNVTTAATIKIAVGPTTATGSRFSLFVTAGDVQGLLLVTPGLPLRNAKTVKAWVTTANAFTMFGYVNRFAT